MFLSFVLRLSLLIFLREVHRVNGKNVTFVPKPIRVAVVNLPKPYTSSSASKGARVYPVPEDPILYAPKRFSVKLYMTDLTAPRYLIYTPTNDILVSESSANRISCLVDNDHDGYPDQRLTFADASNGLNYPFGMAFFNGYFYVGNKNATRRYLWTSGSRNITGRIKTIICYLKNLINAKISKTALISNF